MQHFWSLDQVYLKDSWLTIGSYDGVHLGHRAIIRQLIAGAHEINIPAVVITFYPHPATVLRDRRRHFYLTSPEEQSSLLEDMGVDVLITHPFNKEISKMSAYDFIAKMDQHLDFSHLWVGHDFTLGRDREGDIPTLQKFGESFGYRLNIVDPIKFEDGVVSSSVIRAALASGDMEMAHELLGRPYQVDGVVVPGDGRGRTFGIPTANLDVWSKKALPKVGVYVCRAVIDGKIWGAVTNIGVRPTFDANKPTPRIETHLLNFNEKIYGKTMSVFFIARLRDEKRFSNTQTLVNQIHLDIHAAEVIFESEVEKFIGDYAS
jgi:riboflavin kinase/FMN adenylyltransferase